jgi:hypothetical protein
VISIIPRGGPSALDGITPSAFEFVRLRVLKRAAGFEIVNSDEIGCVDRPKFGE